MAHTFRRVRVGWGAVDYEYVQADTPQYASTEYAYAGESAAAGGGVGVRRATLIFSRQGITPTDDDMNCHFDFMNITSGAPDDTWIPADFTTLETALTTWYNGVSGMFPSYSALYRIAWHRVGPGVIKPNPAERILDLTTPIVGAGNATSVPQAAQTLTLRTGVRRSWGRTYLPYSMAVSTGARASTIQTDTVVSTAITLYNTAKAADFLMGVTSKPKNSFLGVESFESDSTIDIVRRRRWKHTSYRKITPVT
jgi:hypothetical protein